MFIKNMWEKWREHLGRSLPWQSSAASLERTVLFERFTCQQLQALTERVEKLEKEKCPRTTT